MGQQRWILLLGTIALTVATFELAYPLKLRGLQERIGVPVDGRLEKTDAEWRASLTPEQFHVTAPKGDGTGLQRGPVERARRRHVSLRLLRASAFRFQNQIRLRHRLA